MPKPLPLDVLWVPGTGPDPAALAELQRKFPRPRKPMGEAWFMGDSRFMFDALCQPDFAQVDPAEVDRALEEIGSGMRCFGFMQEWWDWLHYLLPRVTARHASLPKSLLDSPVCGLVSALITHHPDGFAAGTDAALRGQVLITLGRSLMDGARWSDGLIRAGSLLHDIPLASDDVGRWWETAEDLNCLLFLCLKCLAPAEVGPWAASVLRIPDPHWRAQMVLWMTHAGMRRFDLLGASPTPSLGWPGSDALAPDAAGLPVQNIDAFVHAAKSHFAAPEVLLSWWESVSDTPYLAWVTGQVLGDFELLYAR